MFCAGSAFGPDYAHQKGSAFGIYACGFDHNCQRDKVFQQVQPGTFILGVFRLLLSAASGRALSAAFSRFNVPKYMKCVSKCLAHAVTCCDVLIQQ